MAKRAPTKPADSPRLRSRRLTTFCAYDSHGVVHIREVANGGNIAAFQSLLTYAKERLGGALNPQRLKKMAACVCAVHRWSYAKLLNQHLTLADFYDRLLISPESAALRRLNQQSGPKRSKPEGSRKGIGGRHPLPANKAKRRTIILEAWARAKGAGVRQKDFCKDNNLTTGELGKYVTWQATRNRRNRAD